MTRGPTIVDQDVKKRGTLTTYGYDPAANLVSTTLPSGNGYVESRTYDRSGRLTEVKNQKAATVLSRSTYSLDPIGNRLSAQTATETATYTYDPLDRLTKVCYTVACVAPGDNFRQYTYDLVGNRLTEVRDTGTTTYAYDAADQLTGTTGPAGPVGYTYDLDGRTLTAGTQTLTWAQPDRLATLTQGSTTTTYTYDGDGLRLQASTGTQAAKKTNFEFDVIGALPALVAERDGSGGLVRRYLNGRAPISMTAGTKTAYYAYDGLGSVVNLTSSAGATWWTYAYLPFGGVRSATKNNNQATDNVLRFAGGYLDPTTLYHFGARQYDPGAGRFLSTDPVGPGVGDPYVGAYLYANNNPVRFTDPSGRCFGPLVFLAPACIGAAIGVVSYIASTVGANIIGNAVSGQDLLMDPAKGLNPVDAGLSGVAGVITGPLGGISYGPTRIAAGAMVGCATTFASQASGGRTGDINETAVGCLAGGAGSVLQLSSRLSSAIYGTIIALAQALGTTAEQRAGSPGTSK